MDSSTRIQAYLGAVRRRLRRRALGRAALWAGAGLVGLAVATPLLALAIAHERGQSLGVAALVAGVAAFAAAVIAGVIVPRRRWRADDPVARFVGGKHPPLASDLLSSVELGGEAADTFSPELVGVLLDNTAAALDDVDPDALAPRRELRRPAAAFGAALAVALGAAALAPGALGEGYDRLTTAPPPGPFGGAALSSEPIVGDLEVTLKYPLYSGRAPLALPASSGEFRAMPGTTIELETTALKPVAAAHIVFEPEPDGETRDDVEMEVDGRTLRARFTVERPTEYRFLLEDGDGHRRVEAEPHKIEIDPDHAPTVELYAPAEELDVTSLKRVELAYITEDDFGIDRIELVWENDGAEQRKTLATLPERPRAAQEKLLWDLAEVSLEPGVRVPYHIEVTDNDDVLGPNVGSSAVFYLRVFSPRERHEQNIERQRELFEKLVRALGGRLVVATEDLRAHVVLSRDTEAIVVELGTLVAGLADDELAAKDLIVALEGMRGRLDDLVKAETALVTKMQKRQQAGASNRPLERRLAASDAALVTELEDDVLLLADWIDRQEVEVMLAISDEIEGHQARLRELMKEYARTGSEELKKEIEREMRALEARLAELAQKRGGLTEDVLDRYVNSDAVGEDEAADCMAEVRALIEADEMAAAQKKLEECSANMQDAFDAMEESLRRLRGDKFSEEERKLEEILDELADVARDQRDIAEEADDIFDSYADRADEMMREGAKEMRRKLSRTIDELRERLDRVPESGLTPFSKEELEIVESRLDDLEEMLDDGDIAEALAMAKQAQSSLETMEAELDAALAEEAGAPWARQTRKAKNRIERARPLADKIVRELEKATPSPDEIMSRRDRRRLGRLRRRQQAARGRAQRLADKVEKMSAELPGDAGEAISRGVRDAGKPQQRAQERMRARDPSGARHEAGVAADRLDQVREDAQGAARQRRAAGRALRDEPIRIPGADEYETPEEFREDILEAMKKEKAPDGFDDLVRRYYEELIK